MAAKKSQVDYSLRLPSSVPYEDSKDSATVREYVERLKSDYYGADVFKKYKKRCETTKYLINQLWESGKKSTKFGFRLGMMRAGYDNYRDALHDLFDLDEFVYLTAQQKTPDQVAYVDHLQGFIINLLRQISYKKMWFRRLDYLPDYGWSPACTDFRYAEGFQLRPNKDFKAQGAASIPFDQAWGTTMSKPVSKALHPYAWFTGNIDQSSEFASQGYIKRWYLGDVYAAGNKKTPDGKPIYNPKAIEKLKETLGKKQTERDSNMPESKGRDMNDHDSKVDPINKQPYVDVTYFHGCLAGCSGYYDDPTVYLFEGTKTLTLRFVEDPLGSVFEEITHAKTHAFRSNPFSRSWLDGIREHQRMSDLLLNLGIENQIDSMHRFWWLNEDDLLDPNDFYNPRGLNTFLQAAREGARPPQRIADERSGSLQDLQEIFGILDHDRQIAGVTDQEAGMSARQQEGGGNSTATQASILKSASSKKIRAVCKRISEDALIPEIKYLTVQALLYFSPDQLTSTTKDGQIIQLTPEHMKAFIQNSEFRTNDHVTRDSDSDALKSYNFWMSGLKLSQQLADPATSIKIIRSYGRKLSIEDLDEILPAPAVPDASAQPPGMPGMPPAPGAAPAIAPPTMAPPQPTFQQPQGGQFNVAVQ
jgi:hypothetical protein